MSTTSPPLSFARLRTCVSQHLRMLYINDFASSGGQREEGERTGFEECSEGRFQGAMWGGRRTNKSRNRSKLWIRPKDGEEKTKKTGNRKFLKRDAMPHGGLLSENEWRS